MLKPINIVIITKIFKEIFQECSFQRKYYRIYLDKVIRNIIIRITKDIVIKKVNKYILGQR